MEGKIDIYMQEDGFYVGRKLKNGKMGKTAYKLTAQDIMTMFTQFFTDYCNETGKTQLAMQDASGQLFVTSRVPAEKAGEAKE